MRSIGGIWAGNVFAAPVTFEFDRFTPAIAALDQCVDDLLASWGLDVPAAKTAVQPAERVNFERLLEAILRGAPERSMPRDGMVSFDFHVVVGLDGKPTRCVDSAPAEFAELGLYTCEEAVENLRYRAAMNAAGEAVPAIDSLTVVYQH